MRKSMKKMTSYMAIISALTLQASATEEVTTMSADTAVITEEDTTTSIVPTEGAESEPINTTFITPNDKITTLETVDTTQRASEKTSTTFEEVTTTVWVPLAETEPVTTSQNPVKVQEPVEDIVKVIIETRDQSALERADHHEKDLYNEAVVESEADVLASFDRIRADLNKQGLDITRDLIYSGSFSGFSSSVDQKTLMALSSLKDVLNVQVLNKYTRPVAEPTMLNSGPLIGMDLLKDYQTQYKGENIVVSVIDTGFDPFHRDFVMADDIEKRYDQAEMTAMIKALNLPGKWYSNKIAYGYNYADNTDSLLSQDQHGNHVAGIIGANGDVSQGGIQGIAPHVQLLLMKTFSEDQVDASVYEDVWLKAFDDSIKLGADVINMSLGMMSGFNMDGDTPMARAVQRARDLGILPIIAAGNDHNATAGTNLTSLADNVDNGLMGYPANVEGSLAVASFDNLKEMRRYIEAKFSEAIKQYPGSFTYPEGESAPLPLVEFGLGNSADYTQYKEQNGQEIDFTGKIVIVQRGDASFNEKYNLAQEHGAAGVIIYDNTDAQNPMKMTGLNNLKVPVMFITQKSGLELIDLMKQNADLTVRITKELLGFDSPTAGNLSDFSSWGPTSDLRLKPDIAGLGGNIYSLMSDDQYQNMSGTSMATPQMAGVAAVLIQRLYEEGILKSDGVHKDPLQDDLAMLMLMNTAIPKLNTLQEGTSYYTPIQQGAGLVNIAQALNNLVTVTATNKMDQVQDGKLEIKEVGDQFDFQLNLKNYGDQAASYKVSYVLLKDAINEDGRQAEYSQEAGRGELGEVTVAANGTVSLSRIISTLGIENNRYVQGYIFLTPTEVGGTPLSLPIFGFKGEWDKLPIIDKLPQFNDESEVNFEPAVADNGYVDYTGFVRKYTERGWEFWNAWKVDDKPVVFVNSNEVEGMVNEVQPILSFLRNAVDVTFDIEDASNEIIRHLGIANRVIKTGKLYEERYRYLQDIWPSGWNYLTTFGDKVAEGFYNYKITARIDAPGAEKQTYNYQLVLDNTPTEVKIETTGDQLNLAITDNLSGIHSFELYAPDGRLVYSEVIDKTIAPQLLNGDYQVTIPEEFRGQNLELLVYDNSRNTFSQIIGDYSSEEPTNPVDPETPTDPENPTDPETPPTPPTPAVGEKPANEGDYATEEGIDVTDMPVIVTDSPWEYRGFGQDADVMDFTGTVKNIQDVNYMEYRIVDMAGNVVLSSQPLAFAVANGQANFESQIDLAGLQENGLYTIEAVAYTVAPNGKLVKEQVAHRFRVDRQAPELELTQTLPQEGEDPNYLYFDINFSDNMNYVELWAGESLIGRIDRTYDTLEPLPVDGSVRFKLPKTALGRSLTFKVTDDFGNSSEKSFIEMVLQDLIQIAHPTEQVFNPDLPVGTIEVVQEGKDGLANVDAEGNPILPALQEAITTIIHYGPVEINFDEIVIENHELLEGVEQIIRKGAKGLMNPLTQEIIRQAIPQIIEVGTKTTSEDNSTDDLPTEDTKPVPGEAVKPGQGHGPGAAIPRGQAFGRPEKSQNKIAVKALGSYEWVQINKAIEALQVWLFRSDIAKGIQVIVTDLKLSSDSAILEALETFDMAYRVEFEQEGQSVTSLEKPARIEIVLEKGKEVDQVHAYDLDQKALKEALTFEVIPAKESWYEATRQQSTEDDRVLVLWLSEPTTFVMKYK